MKVIEKQVRKLEITEIPDLDPITVIIEEYGVGQAKVIIQCWDRSWNAYWGSMGGDLKEFFTRTNVHYLVGKFSTELERGHQELDYHAMSEVFVKKVQSKVIERRREYCIGELVARDVYDECTRINIEDICPKHPYDDWNMDHWSVTESSWKSVFYDKDYFNEWCYDNIDEIYEPNHNLEYLKRIVEVVREAVINS